MNFEFAAEQSGMDNLSEEVGGIVPEQPDEWERTYPNDVRSTGSPDSTGLPIGGELRGALPGQPNAIDSGVCIFGEIEVPGPPDATTETTEGCNPSEENVQKGTGSGDDWLSPEQVEG